MLAIKPGVMVGGLKPELLLAINIAHSVYQGIGKDCTITSCTDSKHSRTSLHYVGFAVDIRTRNLTNEELTQVYADLRERLNAEYDVVKESNHFHVEFQPKR